MAGKAILVVGDVMTDIIVRPHGALVMGSDRAADIGLKPGGSGANQAVWLGAMGADVRFRARVGAGDVAQLRAHFAGFGVTPLLVGDADKGSGVLVTLVSPDGERSFLTDRGANLGLCADDLPDSLLDGVGLLLVSGYTLFAKTPREAMQRLFAVARERGVAVALDAASVGFIETVGVANFLAWAEGATTLLANEDEARVLCGTGDLDAQMRILGERFERVIVKLGAAGAAIGGRDGVMLRQAAPVVPVVDTTGAGDAFAAAFLAHEIGGKPLALCLAAGIEAGSAAVGQVGGQPNWGA